MKHQAILYDTTTGQILQVADPLLHRSPEGQMVEVPGECGPEVVKMFTPGPGQAVIAHQKGLFNRLHEWQLTVTRACGRIPEGQHPDVCSYVMTNLDKRP